MLKCLRSGLSVCVLAFAAAATAEDAYFQVPIDDLEITEGALPKGQEPVNWQLYQRARRMQPYVVLDGEGEAYVAYDANRSRAEWNWPANRTRARNQVVVRVPAARDVTGRIYLPKRDLTGMVQARFKIAAAKAEPEARTAFFQLKRQHYDRLLSRNIPGGAWFRHQARMARKALQQRPGDLAPARPVVGRAGRRAGDLSQTFELFTGGRAISENLQLDRALAVRRANDKTVAIDSIEGITIQAIDWKPLIEGKHPKLDPLADRIPADQHVVFFPTFKSALTMADETKETGELIFQMAEPHSADARTFPRYQKQMCLSISGIARLLGPRVCRSVALTGSDSYFPTGTDVAVLFEAPDPAMLERLILAQVAMKAQAFAGAKPIEGAVAGVAYHGYRSADRAVCCYVARMKGAVVVTNSPCQLERLAAVAQGKAASIASLDEYIFFRDRYPLGDKEETAFLFLSDATIRRWCGPKWRIASSRRTRDAAVMAEIQAEHLDRLARGDVEPGPIYTDLPTAFEGDLRLTPDGVVSSNLGTLDFMTPIAEMELSRVTKDEAEAYERWRRGYQNNWQWAFDPIGLRLGVSQKRLSADLTVMPLIWGSDYRELVRVSQGATFGPASGDPHDALGHAILALDRKSAPVRQASGFARMMAPGVSIDPLGWLGSYVEVYVDDDPIWAELAKVDPSKREEFLEKNAWRFPVAVRADVSSGLRLTAFLTALRAFVDQTAPGMTHWESLEYKKQPFVKITPTDRATRGDESLEKLAVYYTASGESLFVTLSEDLLKRSIDRELARHKAKAEGKTPPAPKRPWLGRSLGFQAEQKLIAVAAALGRREYQTAMQMRAWDNLPILNEWKRRYGDQDPIQLHAKFWQTELVCPGAGRYVWNEKWQTMESTVYGHPGDPKDGPPVPPMLGSIKAGNFGLSFEKQGLRAKVSLER